ncbi:relaxase/mobilization nuclease domain-containing protein [Microcoleus sp. FACHB-1515]|uniref:relaxase/mobilization nuclease domain-containing protein n=1 Tax=Cyanophyceae TaxID=3028117 RepID=UPI0016896825|nr:relaxase/mobilization nuclease domain-containing protein [Microcoleus sp. FACHB-1515]MBD2093490.1 relaxase/mobilization nuclease domain-containing protein [Microcoleus sp. FACHB-1515]
MLIAVHTKPHNIYHVLKYVVEKPGVEIVGSTLVSDSIADLEKEILITQPLNRAVMRNLYHGKISVKKGTVLSSALWEAIALDLRDAMDYKEQPYLLARHRHQGHDHVHVLFGRIDESGKCVSDSWDYYKAQVALREIAERYELPSLKFSWEKLENAPTFAEVHRQEVQQQEYMVGQRTQLPDVSIRSQLIQAIQAHVGDNPTLPQFIERLQREGIEVRIYPQRPGRQPGDPPGISFQLHGVKFAGSSLGRGYSLPGLQKYHQVSYVPDRDDLLVTNLLANPVTVIEHQLTLDTTECETMLPEKIEENWPGVKQQLIETCYFPQELIDQLHQQGWLYADRKKRWVFVESSMEGLHLNGLCFDFEGAKTFETFAPPEHHLNSLFRLQQGEGKIDQVIVVSDPLEVLATYALDGQVEPDKTTLYLSTIRPEQLPLEILKIASRVMLSSCCTDAIKVTLTTEVPHLQVIDPAHEQGWLGQWLQTVQLTQKPSSTQKEFQVELD